MGLRWVALLPRFEATPFMNFGAGTKQRRIAGTSRQDIILLLPSRAGSAVPAPLRGNADIERALKHWRHQRRAVVTAATAAPGGLIRDLAAVCADYIAAARPDPADSE